MKKRLTEMKKGDRFFLFPVSPIRTFVSLEFVQPERWTGYWELTTEGEDGRVRKHPCTDKELSEEWNVLP